jgi:hypothetical protein
MVGLNIHVLHTLNRDSVSYRLQETKQCLLNWTMGDCSHSSINACGVKLKKCRWVAQHRTITLTGAVALLSKGRYASPCRNTF